MNTPIPVYIFKPSSGSKFFATLLSLFFIFGTCIAIFAPSDKPNYWLLIAVPLWITFPLLQFSYRIILTDGFVIYKNIFRTRRINFSEINSVRAIAEMRGKHVSKEIILHSEATGKDTAINIIPFRKEDLQTTMIFLKNKLQKAQFDENSLRMMDGVMPSAFNFNFWKKKK